MFFALPEKERNLSEYASGPVAVNISIKIKFTQPQQTTDGGFGIGIIKKEQERIAKNKHELKK